MLSRFVARDKWRTDSREWLYAFREAPGEEPDWFGVAYRIPVNPTASFEEQMRQYNERVLPRFADADRKGEWRRIGGGNPDGERF